MDFEYISPILAAGDGDGEFTSAERSAEVQDQFRDKYGRWIEMGRGIKGKVRLGRNRGTDAGRTARVVGKFLGAVEGGKFARVLVDKSDPYFGGKVVLVSYNNAEEILATLDPEYLKSRGIELGKNTEGFEVGDEGIQDEDTLVIEEPTPEDEEKSKAEIPDPGNYRQEASERSEISIFGGDLAEGDIVYDQGSDQYGKITKLETLEDGASRVIVQFQNGRRAAMDIPADRQIKAWVPEEEAPAEAEAGQPARAKVDASQSRKSDQKADQEVFTRSDRVNLRKMGLKTTLEALRKMGLRPVKKVRKPKFFIPRGFTVVGAWDNYPEWQKELFFSAADLDQFVKLFWANMRATRKGTPLDDGRSDITEAEYAVAAALYRKLKSVDDNYEKRIPTENVDFVNAPIIRPKKMLLAYRGVLIEIDNDKDLDGNYLENLRNYLDSVLKLGLKLPVKITIAKQGTKTFKGDTLGFNEKGEYVEGEADVDEDGGLRLMLFNQLHNLEQVNDIGYKDQDGNWNLINKGGYINTLERVFFHEMGHIWNREKHGRQTNSETWQDFRKIFTNSRFKVTGYSDADFDERMAELFMAAMVALHNGQGVGWNVAQFWKIAVEPFIDGDPSYWTDNAPRVNPPKEKPGRKNSLSDNARYPKDVIPGDVLYDKDGNLQGKVVRIQVDKNGNWHYWVPDTDYDPSKPFPQGLKEFIVHKEGIVYLKSIGVHFVPDNAPDFPEEVPKTLDDSNSSEIKVQDVKPGMVYESPEGPAVVVNIIKQGVNSDPRKNRGPKERVIVYVDPVTGDVKHAVVPTGALVRVMSAPKTDSSEPEEPEDPNLAAIRKRIELAINLGLVVGPDEDQDKRDQYVSGLADSVMEEIKKLGLKDYAALAEYLKENVTYLSGRKPWYTVRHYVKEFLDPGYGKRQAEALDSVKKLLEERLGYEGRDSLPRGVIDDIIRPYTTDEADVDYEELLDILNRNLNPEEIRYIEKFEGPFLESNREEVVKAVQDIIDANLGKKESESEEAAVEEAAATATETTPTTNPDEDEPVGNGVKLVRDKDFIRAEHPEPEFPANTDVDDMIADGFEIEDEDPTGPSQSKKFGKGKKTTKIWYNKDFSKPGARLVITYTRKEDGSLDEQYTEIQWKRWDGSIGGDGYGPSDVLIFEGDSEEDVFDRNFKFGLKSLAERNKEYNNGELPGTFLPYHAKVKDSENTYQLRVKKDPKTGKWVAAKTDKYDQKKKIPFGSIIFYENGKWVSEIVDPEGNVVLRSEIDGDAASDADLLKILNQANLNLAKKHKELLGVTSTPRTTPATTPAGKAPDEHNFPLPDDVEMFKIRNGGLTLYGINLKADVDIFGETSASIRDGLRFGAVIEYIESKGHWYVGLRDANSSLDRERGIDLSLSETYKTIKGDIDDPKAWGEAVKEARKFVSDAIARHGGKNIRYGYEHRPIKSLDDVRVNDYIIFRTSYPPSVNFSDTDRPEEYISSIIGKVLSIGKDKEGNRTFKIQGKDGKIKNLTDKKLDYVGGAVRFSDDDPTIEVSTLEIVKKRVAKREMKELRYFIGMDIDKDPNKSEDSLEKIYKAVEDKIGPDLSEDHIFVQSLQKALSKKMYDKSNTKGYLTEEEIYEIADKAIEKYSTGKKSTTETEDDSEGVTGAHSHPLPDDVQMFPDGVGPIYANYVINGEGFQHEADYPTVRAKDGLRYGVEIIYEKEIEPNSYNKKGRPAHWRIHLLNNRWREDMSRGRLIDYRNAEVPGDINDPEVWKKAVEEARKMLANAVAENGGNNNPYTSEYIALESLDQLQAGDYLMNDAFFPPTIRYEGTKSEEVSPQFYAKIVAVGKDKDGNRIFEIERTAVKDSKPYITVFTDEEFKNQFGIGGGIARYSDENPNVGAPAATESETETEELTEEQLQANKDAWNETGQLYRKYLAAKRGKNMKREAKRLRKELSPFPVVELHETLSDYKEILSNTLSSTTDPKLKEIISKRISEIIDAMKQLNILVNKGMKEGAGKPTDPLDFNFDNLLEEINLEVGTTTEEVTEEKEEEEEEVVEEVAEEPTTTEEPAKNVIETAGGVLDFSGLSPMQLGKINKHLDSKVLWEGESMTYRELYKRFAIGKRKFQVRKDTDYVNGKPVYSWGPIEYRLYIDEKRGMIKVPKMIFDAFKPTSSDPSLNEDRTSEVIEAEWAKKESEEAEASTTPAAPRGFGPIALNSDIAKKYPAMNVEKDWTIYGPDGSALGVVIKKETAGSISKITVRDLQGKETTYNYNNLVKIFALSPKDKKDIEKAEKDKAKKEDTTTPATPATSAETPTTESKDDSATKVVKKEINDAYNVNLKLSVDEKLELWKSLRDRGLITVKNIMDVVPGDYVLAMRNLDYPKPFNWDKWGAKGYYEQEFRKVVSIENEPQRGKLRPILDDGWVSHSSNPAKADVLVLTPDAFESEDTTPESETSDKISREDGFRLFEAIKKVYDFIHKMDRTEDPDAAKKDANDKVNQLAKILNPEDVDDFIRYVAVVSKEPTRIMSSRDYQKNFNDYLDKYTSGQGVANNPIYRSADGKEIKEGDFLTVVGADGTLKKIQLKIFRRPNPRALSDKTDFIETGYYLEFYKDKDPRIVRIGAPKESYSLDNVFHSQNESEIRNFILNGRKSESTPATAAPIEFIPSSKIRGLQAGDLFYIYEDGNGYAKQYIVGSNGESVYETVNGELPGGAEENVRRPDDLDSIAERVATGSGEKVYRGLIPTDENGNPLSASQHKARIESAATSAPEIKPETKPESEASKSYNNDIDNDLGVFAGVLDDFIAKFEAIPNASKDAYKAATKELYNELKKLNSLYESSPNSGSDLEKIREVYDQKIDSLVNIQSEKLKQFGPSQSKKTIAKSIDKIQEEIVDDAERRGLIPRRGGNLFSSLTPVKGSYLKAATAKRLLEYMPGVKLSSLLEAAYDITAADYTSFNKKNHFRMRNVFIEVDVDGSMMIAMNGYNSNNPSANSMDSSQFYAAFNSDLSDLKEGRTILVSPDNGESLSSLTITRELLDAVGPIEDIVKFMAEEFNYKVYSSSVEQDVEDVKAIFISALVKSWAVSSNNENLQTHALQRLASQMFAMDPKTIADWDFTKNKDRETMAQQIFGIKPPVSPRSVNNAIPTKEELTKYIEASDKYLDRIAEVTVDDIQEWYDAKIDKEIKDNREVYTAFIRAQYQLTQDLLKDKSIDSMALYRGTSVLELRDSNGNALDIIPKDNDIIEAYALQRPLSSWSTDIEIAYRFGQDANQPNFGRTDIYPIVMATVVPAERILCFPGNGFGCYEESEVIVLGGTPTLIDFALAEENSRSAIYDLPAIANRKALVRETLQSIDPSTGNTIETIDEGSASDIGPSQSKKRAKNLPRINVDSTDDNANWVKKIGWDLPTNMEDFLEGFETREQLADFMAQPAAQGMPLEMQRDLMPAADEYFTKKADRTIRSVFFTPELFDPSDPTVDHSSFYNIDYTKAPDGSALTPYQSNVLSVLSENLAKALLSGNPNQILEAKNFRLERYLELFAKPSAYSNTTTETIGDSVEGSFDERSFVKKFTNPISLKDFSRYVNYYTDKYGRRYAMVTDIEDRADDASPEAYTYAFDVSDMSENEVSTKILDPGEFAVDRVAYLGLGQTNSTRLIRYIGTNFSYRRRGIATAMLYTARQYSKNDPIYHSDELSSYGFAFSNSVDPYNGLHLSEESVKWQEDDDNYSEGPSQSRKASPEVVAKAYRDFLDEKHPNLEYRPFDVNTGIGIGPDNNIIGLVRPEALKKIQGNLAAEPTTVNSIEQDYRSGEGLYEPVLVGYNPDTGYATVLEGNHRVQAAINAGEEFIPTVLVTWAISAREEDDSEDFTPGIVEKTPGNPFNTNVSSKTTKEVNPYFVFPDSDIYIPEDLGPSQSKKKLPEPFDPLDPDLDLEAIFGVEDYTKMPDGTPLDKYGLALMEFHQARIDDLIKNGYREDGNKAVGGLTLKTALYARRKDYKEIIAKPNLNSSTTTDSVKNQIKLSGALETKTKNGKIFELAIDSFTDKYGREYFIITAIQNDGIISVTAYDKKQPRIGALLRGISPIASNGYIQNYNMNEVPAAYMSAVPFSEYDLSRVGISYINTREEYQRRGIASAMLAVARWRSEIDIKHSEILTKFGFAFANSTDPGALDLHTDEDSIELQKEVADEAGPSQSVKRPGDSSNGRFPEDDGGDEVDTNRSPGNILAAQLKVLADGLGKDFSENADYKDISVDPENLPESLDIWKNLQFMAPMSQDLKIVAAELISAEMKSSAKNILRSLGSLDSEELMDISDEVRSLLEENEDESDDYDIFMRAFETDINNLNIDSLILSYDAEDVLMYVSTMREFIDSDDEDRPDSYFTPERLLKQLNKYIKDVRDSEMQVLSSAGADIQESMRYVGSVLFIKQWAQSANDEILADALQKAAVEAFNMKDGSWATSTSSLENEPDEKLKNAIRKANESYKEKLDYLYDMNSQVYVDFIKSMYKVTQAYLKDLGIEYVRVYRGTGVTEARDVEGDSDFKSSGVGMVDVMQRPMSSWSFDEETALGFAANVIDNDFRDPMFIATLIPASQVLGFPGTGFGSFEEGELVLLGGSPRKVMAAVHKNNSQEKKSTGNWLSDAVVSNDPVSERDFFLRKALPQIDEHFTNLSETDTQSLLKHNSGGVDSTGPSQSKKNTKVLIDNYERNSGSIKSDTSSQSKKRPEGLAEFRAILDIQSELLDKNPPIYRRGGEKNDIDASYDPGLFNENEGEMRPMGQAGPELKAITAKSIGENLRSTPKDILNALSYALKMSFELKTRLQTLGNDEIATEAFNTKKEDLNSNSYLIFVDQENDEGFQEFSVASIYEVVNSLDEYDDQLYEDEDGNLNYEDLLDDYNGTLGMKAIFFDNPEDVELFKEYAASILVSQWAQTSNGDDVISHSLQLTAKDLFKMGDGLWAQWDYKARRSPKDLKENAEYHYGMHSSVLKDFLKTMYDLTQDALKNAGVEYLTVYRGTGVDEEAVSMSSSALNSGVGDVEIVQRPMSAWAWAKVEAMNFAADSKLVDRPAMFMGTIVPAEQVLSFPGTGFGAFEEAEVVLLAGNRRKVRAIVTNKNESVVEQSDFLYAKEASVAYHLLSELPNDEKAFNELIEFNRSTSDSTGPSQSKKLPKVSVDSNEENSDWTKSASQSKKEPLSLRELHDTYIKAILSAAADQKTRRLSGLGPTWAPVDIRDDSLTPEEAKEIYEWYMSYVADDNKNAPPLSQRNVDYISNYLMPLINQARSSAIILPVRDMYIDIASKITVEVDRFAVNPALREGTSNYNTQHRAATAEGVSRFINKLSNVVSRSNINFRRADLKVRVTHPKVEAFFKPSTNPDGSQKYTLAGMAYPNMYLFGPLVSIEEEPIVENLVDNPRAGATDMDRVIAHELGHILGQENIIDFKDQQIIDTITRFMKDYPLTDYADSDIEEYISEAYAGMMVSEDGIGKHKEVADFINYYIDLYNQKNPATGPSPSKKIQIVNTARNLAATGLGFDPGVGKKKKANLPTGTGRRISIPGQTDVAKPPTEDNTRIKNNIITLGHLVLDDAILDAESSLRDADLLPEGLSGDAHRKQLEKDASALKRRIKAGDSELEKIAREIIDNGFNNLGAIEQEEIYQMFKVANDEDVRIISEDKRKFDEETLNMARLEYNNLIEFLNQTYVGKNSMFQFDVGVTQRFRLRSPNTDRITNKIETRNLLFDLRELAKNPSTMLDALTEYAIMLGRVDISSVKDKAAELKDLRDQLKEIENKKTDLINKYHELIGSNVISRMKDVGIEFDSVKASELFSQNRDSNWQSGTDPLNNKSLKENLQKTLDFIPKNIILAGIAHLAATKGKLAVYKSTARAHFYEVYGGGFFRGDTPDDFHHEVWHFFQNINPDITTIEHAFTYDRVKTDENTLKGMFKMYENWRGRTEGDISFSGADIVNPYTVKQYPGWALQDSIFNPNNQYAEVVTTAQNDLFTRPGQYSTPRGVTVATGFGKNITLFSDAHIDIATGIWYTDETMTDMIDSKKITSIQGLDRQKDTDWDLKAFAVGMLLALGISDTDLTPKPDTLEEQGYIVPQDNLSGEVDPNVR